MIEILEIILWTIYGAFIGIILVPLSIRMMVDVVLKTKYDAKLKYLVDLNNLGKLNKGEKTNG